MQPFRSTTAAALAAACLAADGAPAAEDTAPPLTITRAGSNPSARGAPDNFSGAVRIDSLHRPQAPWRTSAGMVTFEPGARTVWHTHPLGQVLIVTAGAGRVQRWAGPVETIRPGDVVWIPAGVKHWHGAGTHTGMSHIAITEALDGKNVDWLEAVNDAPAGR